MSNLLNHAKREFLAAGYKPIEEEEDGPDKWIQENVLELLEVFAKQGHSGFSAGYCLSYFAKLADFKPLCPLTGDDTEWNDTGGDILQNNRCPSVFKDKKSGVCYTIEGYVFREPSGSCFTGHNSRKLVEFPYMPTKPTYVDVVSVEVNKDTNALEPGSGWWKITYPEWLETENLQLDALIAKGAE